MQDATELGKFLRELMARNNLRQEQMAKELGVSPSILSNYIIGKNIPDMDFLAKCVDRFNLKKNDLKSLLIKAFISSIKTSQKVILDTRYFKEDRLNTLIQILVVLQLRLDIPTLQELPNLKRIIKNNYDAMDNDNFLELVRPSQDDK
jgi:transcriptional regulator with XRE-family HTH domain